MYHGEQQSESSPSSKNIVLTSIIAGASAGLTCDIVFFPIDTLKTRLQSQHGFFKSGGFRQLYRGLLPVAIGSAPSGALFFVTYEVFKEITQPFIPIRYHSITHMGAACVGEMAACIIRVPVEVVKQRSQAFLKDEGRLKLSTLYRGYGSTVLRDLPFGFIQMPLWEYFKLYWKNQVHRDCTPIEGATCGALSVAISAAVTTPLDVAKTRIMLSSTSADKEDVKISVMLKDVYKQSGFRGLFAGFTPRVAGFTLGGFVYFGVYEKIKTFCQEHFKDLR